jgi:hypothetical protein
LEHHGQSTQDLLSPQDKESKFKDVGLLLFSYYWTQAQQIAGKHTLLDALFIQLGISLVDIDDTSNATFQIYDESQLNQLLSAIKIAEPVVFEAIHGYIGLDYLDYYLDHAVRLFETELQSDMSLQKVGKSIETPVAIAFVRQFSKGLITGLEEYVMLERAPGYPFAIRCDDPSTGGYSVAQFLSQDFENNSHQYIAVFPGLKPSSSDFICIVKHKQTGRLGIVRLEIKFTQDNRAGYFDSLIAGDDDADQRFVVLNYLVQVGNTQSYQPRKVTNIPIIRLDNLGAPSLNVALNTIYKFRDGADSSGSEASSSLSRSKSTKRLKS